MGMAGGSQPLPFGHSTDAAVDIEGLVVCTTLCRCNVCVLMLCCTQLLEDHLKKLREEEGVESGEEDEDNEAAWEGWDLESDSSEESDDSGGWIDVESDGDEELEISDSEDEGGKQEKKTKNQIEDDEKAEATAAESTAARISSLATTKVSADNLA